MKPQLWLNLLKSEAYHHHKKMFRQIYSRVFNLECSGCRSVPIVKFEAKKLKYSEKQNVLNRCIVGHHYTINRHISQNSLSHVFSDESKERFIKTVLSIKCKEKGESEKNAAVLVPFCEVNGVPSVILTKRSSSLGRNKGDVSFPGGMSEDSDKDLIHSALRETEEEIGISQKKIQVWTKLFRVDNGAVKVTPIIAYVTDFNVRDFVINQSEVEKVFTLSLESLCNPKNFHFTEFKNGYVLPTYLVDGNRVWGLTAGILHHILGLLLPDIYKNKLPFPFKKQNKNKK